MLFPGMIVTGDFSGGERGGGDTDLVDQALEVFFSGTDFKGRGYNTGGGDRFLSDRGSYIDYGIAPVIDGRHVMPLAVPEVGAAGYLGGRSAVEGEGEPAGFQAQLIAVVREGRGTADYCLGISSDRVSADPGFQGEGAGRR